MIPEISFAVKLLSRNLNLENEHSEYKWLPYDDAIEKLKYDSNKSAVLELHYRLKNGSIGGINKNIASINKFISA
jgi:dATP pyrophosphohydrolase